jgi:cellulose synthase/poly-beta-1,6-N-acetylglucosamine synthase-like glycosyltransferase/HEAT repeat protein
MDARTILFAMFTISLVIAGLILMIFLNKQGHDDRKTMTDEMDRFIIDGVLGKEGILFKKDAKLFMKRYTELKQVITIDADKEAAFMNVIETFELEDFYRKRLRSRSKYHRIEAAVYLGVIGTETARKAIEDGLYKERYHSAKLYYIHTLVGIKHPCSIPPIAHSLLDAPQWYREKVHPLLNEYGRASFEFFAQIKDSKRSEYKELIIGFAEAYPIEALQDYLRDIARDPDEDEAIRYKAFSVLMKVYFIEIDRPEYLKHPDPYIRGLSIRAYGANPSVENLYVLIPLLTEDENREAAMEAIGKILAQRPPQVCILLEEFRKYSNENVRSGLAELIAKRVDYMMLKVSADNKEDFKTIIKEIMLRGKNSNIISFLNKNCDMGIEREMIPILRDVFDKSPEVKLAYRTYLNESLLKKCGQTRFVPESAKREEKQNKRIILYLYFLLLVLFFSFPAAYAFRHSDLLFTLPWQEQLKVYVLDFNYYLAYYSMAVNSIYLFLLVCSFFGVREQARYWKLKKMPFLFKKKMMPSVSIIAPAFNEEASIIESANSLMNLKYPDYELIIVNDGSKDQTLQTLIQYFELEKVDQAVNESLRTMPIKGIYRNETFPKLTVVDKENGGKADSLNTGINFSAKDYFCGIDSDSLLETDALLKLASLMLDEEVECPALGGNIFPVNGCTIDKGMLTDQRIPENRVARLQMIEYIRAFMAGRVGWAQLDCLLIISGAFGLFKRDRIIEIGGYLTSSGEYQKDTVGEDMELVVRLNCHMLEKKQKFKIKYSYNANCWTEVPESFRVLKRQRDRWHRGLIDILTFHKKMIGNPRYGKAGTIAMPYFFIFEMMGPLVEMQGYVMVFLAAVFGMLNLEIAGLLFVSIILMGILISVSSLYLAEKESDYFTFKELAVLVFYAFIENFGLRQLISFWRVTGYVNSLKKPKGWGKMERKGFAVKTDLADVQSPQ